MTLKVTYIGHATVLVEWDGLRFLTDPVLSHRVLFFKRLHPLKMDFNDLFPLNAILISHAHYDHLDLCSFKYIPDHIPIIVPEGVSSLVAPLLDNHVIELGKWSRFCLGDVTVCAVPAKHPGGRLCLPLRYRTCVGYVVTKGNESIYFAGDTAYHESFKELKKLFQIKLALLPVSTFAKGSLLRKCHMNVDDFIQAWLDLGSPESIPIHWGTFFHLFGNPHTAVELLQRKAQDYPELKKKLHIVIPHSQLTLA